MPRPKTSLDLSLRKIACQSNTMPCREYVATRLATRPLSYYKESPQSRFQPLRVPRLAFPNHNNSPSERLQGGRHAFVARDVALKLLGPECCVRAGRRGACARSVTVPKATVNKYARVMASEHDIRPTRQSWMLDAEAEPQAMKARAND